MFRWGRDGYYIVRPDSPLFRQLALYEAPYIDTADWLHHGYGADVLAFRFNQKGVLHCGAGLHRTGMDKRFSYASNRIADSWPCDCA
jgi:hypothetical protein